jgi:multisubunit Na+/H+ antiporter MnhE subunit
MVLWLLLTSTVNAAEALVGFGASAIAATATELVRSNRGFGFRPRLLWVRLALGLPVRIARDTVTVFRVLLLHVTGRKRVRGSWHAVPFRHGRDGDARDTARRGLVTIAVTTSPNSLVLEIDPERDELVVHQLVSAPEDVERMLGRSR